MLDVFSVLLSHNCAVLANIQAGFSQGFQALKLR